MNKNYLKYLFKTNRNKNIFLLIMHLLISAVFVINSVRRSDYVNFFTISTILLMIECFTLPIVELGIIQNRRSVDMYYSLPVKHNDIIITTYISIVLKLFTIGLLSHIPILISIFYDITIGGTIIYFAVLFLMIVAVSIFSLGITLKCNSIIDGFIVGIAYSFIPLLIYAVIICFFYVNMPNVYLYNALQTEYFYMPASILNIIHQCVDLIMKDKPVFNDIFKIACVFCVVGYALIGLLFTIYELKNRKSERAEQITNNFSTYPFVIGSITICLLLISIFEKLDTKDTIFLIAFIFIAYLIMTFIYLRKIIITKKSVILFLLAITLSYAMMGISDMTNGFGLKYSYRNHTAVNKLQFYSGINFYDDYKGFYVDTVNENKNKALNEEIGKYLIELQDNLLVMQEDMAIGYMDTYIPNCTIYMSLHITYDDAFFEYYYNVNYHKDNPDELKSVIEILDKLMDYGVEFTFSDNDGVIMSYDDWYQSLNAELKIA